MTPTEVFTALIDGMEADNGCAFDVSPVQRAEGESYVAVMQAKGWKPDGLTPGLDPDYNYKNDIKALSMGEIDDALKIARTWGGEKLHDLLENIFDPE